MYQTSMYNFFKSVNPRSQVGESSRKKRANTLTTTPNNILRNIRNRKVTKVPRTMKPNHRQVKTSITKTSPAKFEVVDVCDSDDEADSISTITLLDSSYENTLSVTPTKHQSLKRSNSDRSDAFSACKKPLNNASKAVIKNEVVDVSDSDTETDSKSTITLLDSAYENKLSVTLTKDQSLKHFNSSRSGDSSPCKKQLNNASSAVIKDEVIDILERYDDLKPLHAIKRGSSCENEIPVTPTKEQSFNRSLSKSGGSPSPRKKQLTNGDRNVVKHLKHRVSVRDREKMDMGKLLDMIENLNKARSGVIPKTCYNLEQYYAGIVKPRIRDHGVDDVSAWYDTKGVTIPEEKHARHFHQLLTDVFCKPQNCGYFSDGELDQIFGFITLSTEAQVLFIRLIKRKYCWRRAVTIDYPDISEDLRPYFDELENQGLLTSNTDDLSLEPLLQMLTSGDVKELCRERKMDPKANKETCIKRLVKETSNKPLWPGMESPAAALRRAVLAMLVHCVCLPKEVINLVDRIVTLSMPSKDPTTTLVSVFLELTMIEEGTVRFPEVPVSHDPVFQDREHLIRFVEQTNNWRDALDPDTGTEKSLELGRNAHARLMILLGQNQMSSRETQVPRHVQKFREEYVCIKILTRCLESFKKHESTLPEAVQMLRDIISQEILLQGRKGDWYEELALIEGWHKKDRKTAAILTIEGLRLEKISDVARHSLNKRATNLAKRKDLSQDVKSQLTELMEKENSCTFPKVSINGNALQGNHPGRKSTWQADIQGDKAYMSVEHRALMYYKNNGYPCGWHCEGNLPQILFTLLLWNEIYSVPVPAAFLSPYQKAPLDLYTSDFHKNRHEQINKRIAELKRMSSDEIAEAICQSFETRQNYSSLLPPMPPYLDENDLMKLVRCMGPAVVSGICERMSTNYCGWKAGFPDLIIWNSELEYKIVEVKGPGDTLSPKQTLWLQYLEGLGASVELCEIKDVSKKQR